MNLAAIGVAFAVGFSLGGIVSATIWAAICKRQNDSWCETCKKVIDDCEEHCRTVGVERRAARIDAGRWN